MQHRFLLVYLIVIHLLVLAGAIALLRDTPLGLVGVELGLFLTFLLGLSIWRRMQTGERLLRDGTAALRDQDYSLRLRAVGLGGVDELIQVYNDLLAKIREERLDNQRQQFFLTLLIESTSLGVFTMGFEGELQQINSWGRQQIQLAQNATLPTRLIDIEHPLAQAMARMGEHENLVLRLPNHQRYRCESANFIDRGFSRRFVVAQNISDELGAAEVAAFSQVIRMMAHEVNNATGATRSLLQSMLATDDLDDAAFRVLAKAYLPILLERGAATNDFMQRFAQVVRLPEPTLVDTDLAALLDAQVQFARASCQAAGIQLRTDFSPSIVRADASLLGQVIANGLVNARESIQAAVRSGEIVVCCGAGEFEIADNGPGISDEAADQLFTPFFSTKPNGQGIGLTLTREILDRHGAQYSLATDADGWTRLRVAFKQP